MRKFMTVIAVLIIATANVFAQSSIIDKFKLGTFHVTLEEGKPLSFMADFETAEYNDDFDILSGVFYLSDSDVWKDGREWFIKEYDDETGYLVLTKFFYEKLGIVLGKKMEKDGKIGYEMYLR